MARQRRGHRLSLAHARACSSDIGGTPAAAPAAASTCVDVPGADAAARRRQHGEARHHVLQFAHVAGPGMRGAGAPARRRPAARVCRCRACVPRPATRAQSAGCPRRGRAAAAARCAPRRVETGGRARNSPVGHRIGERPVGGRDDAHVHGARRVLAHAPHLALLQHAQQLGLRARRQLGHLVEEQRAAVGVLEQPGARADGAGEGAARVTEQLGLDQVVGQRGAVDGDNRRSRRALSRCSARATSSLPVPLSPSISTRKRRRRRRARPRRAARRSRDCRR